MTFEEIREKVFNHFDEREVYRYVDDLMWRPEDEDGDFLESDFYDYEVFLPSKEVLFYDAGCTKWVIAYKDIPDWVVKVPFCGTYIYDNENEEGYYDKYIGANNLKNNWNYCERELEIYKEAVKKDMDFFFTETHYLGQYWGMPVYISKKVDDFYTKRGVHSTGKKYEECNSIIQEAESRSKNWNKDYLLSSLYIAKMLDCGYSYEQIVNIILFCQENLIGDFHSGNFGWDEECKLRILDFSSYNEQEIQEWIFLIQIILFLF